MRNEESELRKIRLNSEGLQKSNFQAVSDNESLYRDRPLGTNLITTRGEQYGEPEYLSDVRTLSLLVSIFFSKKFQNICKLQTETFC